MLVIISDLHFTDGTTSNLSADGTDLFNISPEAFRLFFGKISSIIERRKESVREVKFVYNGDIFDPLRTCTWFEVPAGHRFWNVPPDRKAIQKTCGGIVARILHHNQEALAWLSGQHPDFEKTWQVDQEVERVYIPGNHDRLMNLSPYCRRQVQLKLLNCKSSARFDNACLDRRHQTLIIHGHEADPFNCEFDPGGNPKYDDTPIGDVLTTALFANIGHQANGLDIPAAAKERFRDIDNVRPNLAVIRYLQDIITDFAISGKVEKMLQTIVEEFNQLAFYQKWSKAHDQWNLGYDEADKLQLVLRAINLLGPSVPAGLLENLSALTKDDACQKLAKKTLEKSGQTGLRYCIMGHTHEPAHVPLCVDKENNVEKHYLNTGTFRTTLTQTLDRQDFLRFQRMAYVIIYGPNEFAPDEDAPVYEMWSGLRMHH